MEARLKIALVCSHGGHLTELLMLQEAWEDQDVFWITYDAPRTRTLVHAYRLTNIGLNPLRMLSAGWRILRILRRERPDLVISTGAEVAIPTLYLAWMLGIKTIFIEVWTRVRRPTGTGRLVFPICTQFYVQWPQMLNAYGRKAKFVGGLL
jgi:beta-1,4-N-acetylglucosaminyltransferase